MHPVENVNQDVRLPHLASGLRLHIDMGRAAMGWIVGELLPTQPQQQVFVVQASGLAPLFVTNGTAEWYSAVRLLGVLRALTGHHGQNCAKISKVPERCPSHHRSLCPDA